jgi:hypothetical protein
MLKVKGWKKIFQAKSPGKQAGVAIPISYKRFQTKISQERQSLLHIDKVNDSLGGLNYCEHIRIECQCT